MTFDELLSFIEEQGEWLKEKYPDESDEKQRRLLRLAKLTEEVGELAEQVLGSLKQQREREDRLMTSDELSEEVADVLITTLLLASVMKVDIKEALRKKMEKVIKRRA